MNLKIVCGSILAVFIGLASLLVYVVLPHKSGDIHLTYGHGSAKVFFEENGLPHIYADNREIGAFALGYLNAADRLWQLEYFRRISQGRLSEVFGEGTVKLDEAMRLLGLKQSCNLTKDYFSSEQIFNHYDSYVNGINEYAERNPLPLQFQVFFLKFEKWTLVDTCTCLKFFHFSLGHNWGFEIIRDYIEAVSKDQHLIDMLFPYHPEVFDKSTSHVVTEDELQNIGLYVDNNNETFAKSSRSAKLATYLTKQMQMIQEGLQEFTKIDGSNSWIISGDHTKSGKSILCTDPHLSNSAPSLWYMSHIEYADGTYLIGANLPGMAIQQYVTTNTMASGLTNIFADNSDIYEEIIEDGKYLYNDQYYPLEVRQEVIRVKGQSDHVFEVKKTRNGPLIQNHTQVLSLVASSAFPVKIQEGYFSLRWTGFEDVSTTKNYAGKATEEINSGYSTFESGYKAIYSSCIFEAISILKQSTGIHFSIGLADSHGFIGYVPAGSYVKRKQKKFGNTISPGWTDENDWVGFVQPNEKPISVNPKKGFIVHANGPVTGNNVEFPVSVFNPGNARVMRITTLIQDLISNKSGKIEYSDMIEILNDSKDLYAERKKNSMIKILRKHFVKEQHHSTVEVNQIMNWLHLWDSNFDKDLDEPTYFTLWEYFIMKNILVDQLPESDIRMKIVSNPASNTFFLKFYEDVEKNLTYKSEY